MIIYHDEYAFVCSFILKIGRQGIGPSRSVCECELTRSLTPHARSHTYRTHNTIYYQFIQAFQKLFEKCARSR